MASKIYSYTKMITIKVTAEQYQEIKEHYSSYFIDATGDYIDFVANVEGCVITGYSSKKTKKSIIFNGENEYL